MRKTRIASCFMLVILLGVTACNLPKATPSATSGGEKAVATSAAQTVEAMLTQSSSSSPSTVSTATLVSQSTTMQASTSTPQFISTNAASPTFTPTQTLCDQAAFVGESIPDGTEISPEGSFNKTWTLQNIGTCTWNSGYSLVFVDGEAMTSVASKSITTGTVAPGDKVTITITLQAPSKDGTYKGNWMLRNASGNVFGLGQKADQKFWVQIKVVGDKVSYFVDNYCAAMWTNGSSADSLGCPGKSSNTSGFVMRVDAPKLQNGTTDNDIALWTNPQATSGGSISGKYPAVTVGTNQHFKAAIGCFYNAKNCNVKFSLLYNVNNGTDTMLQEWSVIYSSPITYADVDLSSFAGQSVVFTLKVTVISGANQAQAYWLKPRFE